jgi:hypothetical protein
MINDTEGVCLLENLDYDLSTNVEISEQHLLLQDPYDSIWLKIISVLSYFIGLITSAVMLAFISYENGHHGNFRTVINQLLSNLYAMVSKMFMLLDIPEICIIYHNLGKQTILSFNLKNAFKYVSNFH